MQSPRKPCKTYIYAGRGLISLSDHDFIIHLLFSMNLYLVSRFGMTYTGRSLSLILLGGGIFGCYHVSLDYRPVTYEGNFITEMETWKGGGVINVYKDAFKKRSLNASELKFLKIIQRRSICK